MEEKYYFRNVADDFLLVIKCNQTKLGYYTIFEKNVCEEENGVMDLQTLSDWLICHSIPHRAILLPHKRIIRNMCIKWYINFLNHRAKDMLINHNEINDIISKINHGNKDCCWNFLDGK